MSELSILLVDDENFYLHLYADFLESRRYRVAMASSGAEALKILAQSRFDLLITDLLMEDMDGLALTEKVRALWPHMDIIVVTQRDDVRLAVRSMKMGVFEYLVKPVDREELLLAVDRLLERRRLVEQKDRLLNESLEYFQAQTIYKRCLEILSTLDFDNLCQMILRHTVQASEAQGGLLWLASPQAENPPRLNLAGYRGLISLEEFPVSWQPGEAALEKLRQGTPFVAPAAEFIVESRTGRRGALFVPLLAEERLVGMVLLLDRLKGEFSERDRNVAATMGQFSSIALNNARRFQALERLGLRDQGSTAYNLTYFIDYAGKEIYKARRYGRLFSLAVVQLDRYEFLREHFRPSTGRQLCSKLAECLGRVIRDSDILARVSDSEYYLLLPETDSLGARMCLRRAREMFYSDNLVSRLGKDLPVRVGMGQATFPLDGGDFDQLLSCCRERFENNRRSLFWRLELYRKELWEVIETLIGRPDDYRLPRENAALSFRLAEEPSGSSAHTIMSSKQLGAAWRQVCQQLLEPPGRRALVIQMGGVIGAAEQELERMLAAAEQVRLMMLGRRGEDAQPASRPGLTRVFLGDQKMDNHRLLLVLGEKFSYASLARNADDGKWYVFHSHDDFLIESLIVAVQESYNLQRQY